MSAQCNDLHQESKGVHRNVIMAMSEKDFRNSGVINAGVRLKANMYLSEIPWQSSGQDSAASLLRAPGSISGW